MSIQTECFNWPLLGAEENVPPCAGEDHAHSWEKVDEWELGALPVVCTLSRCTTPGCRVFLREDTDGRKAYHQYSE